MDDLPHKEKINKQFTENTPEMFWVKQLTFNTKTHAVKTHTLGRKKARFWDFLPMFRKYRPL